MNKSLKEKAIKFKGKEYVLVADRVIYFNETYPKGCIKTELITVPESKMVIVKAFVYPDGAIDARHFTGYSQATWGQGYINQTSALENAETSAVGRALAMMGIGVIDSIASVDEIKKAESMVEKARNGQAIDIVDYQEAIERNPKVGFQINEAKKEYKRSPEYKKTLVYKDGKKAFPELSLEDQLEIQHMADMANEKTNDENI
jgi:hypothetical protein